MQALSKEPRHLSSDTAALYNQRQQDLAFAHLAPAATNDFGFEGMTQAKHSKHFGSTRGENN
jgi:hypothetical protein